MLACKEIHRFVVRAYSAQASLPVPVITVPKYVTKHIEKKKQKSLSEKRNADCMKKVAYRGNTSVPIISSTKGEFNYYLGQLYHENYPLPLQSKYWFKRKSSGQKFKIHPFGPNPSLPSSDPDEYVDDVYFPNEFSKMHLNENIVNNLLNVFNFEKSTRIQTLAIPRILSGRHMLIATETGSGKTIGYLAPLIHQLSILKETMTLHPDTPLGLIIVPGKELAEQIGNVAYQLAMNSNINVNVLVSGGTRIKHLKTPPNSNIDLLVASLGTLSVLFRKNKFKLANVRHLVLDEADTLLDDSFVEDTQNILRKLMIYNRETISQYGTQLILSSSVYPTNVHSIFCEEFQEEDITKLCSPYLHRVPQHIEQRFWKTDVDAKAGELLQLVKDDYNKKKPVIIFCNKSPSCDWLHYYLLDNGIPNEMFHAGVDPEKRGNIFHAFQTGNVNVLCCTDLASRGLDTQRVKHVINFEFPNNVSDYLLRVGRVGRVGTNHGRVTNLIEAKSSVYTVNDIETAVKKSARIANVDSNIKKKITKLYFSH